MASPRDFNGPGGLRSTPGDPQEWSGRTGVRPGQHDGTDLKGLLSRLGQDASQLAHDELSLARLELRSIAETLSDDVKKASRTLVMDLTKVGIALTLATLAGLALTAGLVIGVGLLVGAYWAGGLIVGGVLLAAAIAFGMSAARDLQTSDALRLEDTRRAVDRSTDVLAAEAKETGQFARDEARDFKHRASPPEKAPPH